MKYITFFDDVSLVNGAIILTPNLVHIKNHSKPVLCISKLKTGEVLLQVSENDVQYIQYNSSNNDLNSIDVIIETINGTDLGDATSYTNEDEIINLING